MNNALLRKTFFLSKAQFHYNVRAGRFYSYFSRVPAYFRASSQVTFQVVHAWTPS